MRKAQDSPPPIFTGLRIPQLLSTLQLKEEPHGKCKSC